MQTRSIAIMIAAIFTVAAFAQGPNSTGTYYSSVDGKRGENLKTALFGVIKEHTILDYSGLEDYYPDTDKRDDGKVWDMYSCITNYAWTANTGNATEGAGWNKEHAVPQSWFGEQSPMKSDIMHVLPTDAKINNMRSNYPYGEVGTVKSQSSQGWSKLGTCKTPGYSGTVFEPNDEYKGDFARIYFYMATCYEDKKLNQSTGAEVFDGSKYPFFKSWVIDMLLRWAAEDPVSQKEIDRNEGVYKHQKNRNPFVDYPGLEQYIWGEWKEVTFSYDNYVQPDDGPVPGAPFYVDPTEIDMDLVAIGTEAFCSFTVTPNEMDGDIFITTSAGEVDVTCIEGTETEPVEVTLYYTPTSVGKQTITVSLTNGTKTETVTVSLRAYSDVPVDYDFAKVTEDLDDWTGTYLIVYEPDKIALDASLQNIDKANNFQNVVITDGTITIDDIDYTQYAVTVTKSGDRYLMQGTSELYIGRTSSSNGLEASASPTLTNTFAVNGTDVDICSNAGTYLRYNTSASRFRYYRSGQDAIQLYRQVSAPTSINGSWVQEFKDSRAQWFITTGTSSLSADDWSEAYNVAGQRVDASYKGVVIVRGRKYLRGGR